MTTYIADIYSTYIGDMTTYTCFLSVNPQKNINSMRVILPVPTRMPAEKKQLNIC